MGWPRLLEKCNGLMAVSSGLMGQHSTAFAATMFCDGGFASASPRANRCQLLR